MYEFHGWVTVQHSAGDDGDAETRRAVELLRARIDDLAVGPGVADLRWVNGTAQLHLGGFVNRPAAGGDAALAAFAYAGAVAPGSYGVLYVHDDEDPASPNAFRVAIMRRGGVEWRTDGDLSPVIPTIEDPE